VSYTAAAHGTRYTFADLRTLLAKAMPARSGDELAGIAARTATELVAACMAVAEAPLTDFLAEPIIPHEADEVTWLVLDTPIPNLHTEATTSRPLLLHGIGRQATHGNRPR
jgi:ethanolamine ammonia-lyase large subunit